MKSRGIASEPDGEIVAAQLEGDIIWVESRGNSWWPAQVVDENGVSGCLKPDNRLEGQILVRLYGSYTYVYADPVKCLSEFDIVLKQNNGCHFEVFQKALEQLKSRAQGSKSKGKGGTQLSAKKIKSLKDEFSVRTSPRRKSTATEQNGQHNKQKPATSSESPSNTEPSARRVRVMQSLGLVAPPGSPFHTNRQT